MSVGPMVACASFGVHRGEKLYSVKEVAELIFDGKSERFVRDLISMGALEAVNIAVDPKGRRELLVREAAIDRFLAERTTKATCSKSQAAVKPSKSKSASAQPEGFYTTIVKHLEQGKR